MKTKYNREPLVTYLDDIETLVSPCRHLPADPAGIYTIGYGETDPKIAIPGRLATVSQASAWRDARLDKLEEEITAEVPFELTQGQMLALMDLAYNIGMGSHKPPASGLRGSTLLRKILARDFAGAHDEFYKWDMANGKHLEGLQKRRHIEAAWFSDPGVLS